MYTELFFFNAIKTRKRNKYILIRFVLTTMLTVFVWSAIIQNWSTVKTACLPEIVFRGSYTKHVLPLLRLYSAVLNIFNSVR